MSVLQEAAPAADLHSALAIRILDSGEPVRPSLQNADRKSGVQIQPLRRHLQSENTTVRVFTPNFSPALQNYSPALRLTPG